MGKLTDEQKNEIISALIGDKAMDIEPLVDKVKRIDWQLKQLVIERAATKKEIARLSDKNRRYNSGDKTVTALAKQYGVNASTISRLRPKMPLKKSPVRREREPIVEKMESGEYEYEDF